MLEDCSAFTVCFKEVTRCSKRVLRVIKENFDNVSEVFQGLYGKVSRAFQVSFKRFQ